MRHLYLLQVAGGVAAVYQANPTPQAFVTQMAELSQRKDWAGLEALCRKQTEAKADDAEAWAGLGFALVVQDKPGAREACSKAIELDPKHLKARAYRIFAEATAGKMEEVGKQLAELDAMNWRFAATVSLNPIIQTRLIPTDPRKTDLQSVRVLHQPPSPGFPEEAKVEGTSGEVQMLLTVGTDGVPGTITILSGSPRYVDIAKRFASQWRFAPYLVQGLPAPFQFRLAMTWKRR